MFFYIFASSPSCHPLRILNLFPSSLKEISPEKFTFDSSFWRSILKYISDNSNANSNFQAHLQLALPDPQWTGRARWNIPSRQRLSERARTPAKRIWVKIIDNRIKRNMRWWVHPNRFGSKECHDIHRGDPVAAWAFHIHEVGVWVLEILIVNLR